MFRLDGIQGFQGPPSNKRVPGVVGVPIGFRTFLPAGRHRSFDHGIFFFDVVDQLRIHVIGAGGGGIEAKHFVELAEDFIHDLALVFHREQPDGQFFRFELFAKLLALNSKKGSADLVAKVLVMFFGNETASALNRLAYVIWMVVRSPLS